MQINGFDKWNLFEYAKTVKQEPLMRVCDLPDWKAENKSVTLSISKEGLRALHGTKLPGAVDVEKAKQMQEILPKLSYNPADEHLWSMRGKVSDAMIVLKEQKENYTLDDMISIRFDAFASEYSGLEKAYADGTRDIWITDGFDEDGDFKFHQVTKEEDFKYLEEGFERMKKEIVSTLAIKENEIRFREYVYHEDVGIDLPADYQDQMMRILDQTINEYNNQKSKGTAANITQIFNQCFNEDTLFANIMRHLYKI